MRYLAGYISAARLRRDSEERKRKQKLLVFVLGKRKLQFSPFYFGLLSKRKKTKYELGLRQTVQTNCIGGEELPPNERKRDFCDPNL